jgi:serine/threonine protein phosphatase PrpC
VTSAVWVDGVTGRTVRAGGASLCGNHRSNNEDRVYIDPQYPFALVLDGMGGVAAGEIAAQKGEEAVARSLRRGLKRGADPRGLIEQALRAGHEAVVEIGELVPEYRCCGTTAVLALLHGGSVYVSWLGDSAAILVSGGRVQQLTWDHDFRTYMIRKMGMSEDEARGYYWRNVILCYLGQWPEGEVQLEILSHTPQPGDRLILASDGVSKILTDTDLLQVCESHLDPKACAEELVNRALENGSRDNCTCAVLAFERSGTDPAPEPPRPQPQSQPSKWWQFWK